VEKSVTLAVAKLPMRLTFTTPAVVLRSWPYGESDKIVRLLTQDHGKVTGIAKGAKRSHKRFANSLESFSLVNLRFQERSHNSLALILSADLAFVYRRLASSLEKIALASYLVEITDALTVENDESALVFKHLKNGLTFLDGHDIAPLKFLVSFELKLLQLVGYQPALDCCKQCAVAYAGDRGGRWYFSPAHGGILCGVCGLLKKETLPLGPGALGALVRMQEEIGALDDRPLYDGSVPAAILQEMRIIIQRYLQYYIEREIKSAAFLAKFVTV
jgi:DNA repair protein RecO (recombination protein O)